MIAWIFRFPDESRELLDESEQGLTTEWFAREADSSCLQRTLLESLLGKSRHEDDRHVASLRQDWLCSLRPFVPGNCISVIRQDVSSPEGNAGTLRQMQTCKPSSRA